MARGRYRHLACGVSGASAAVFAMLTVMPLLAQSARTATPTFTKDIAPVFQEKCEMCHRKEGTGPMSLVSYSEVRPWVRSITRKVEARAMPPWYIDKTVGIQKFADDRSLSERAIALISRVVDAGAPEGDPRDLPTPKAWPSDDVWQFAAYCGRPPDLIVRSPEYSMPAVTQDRWWEVRGTPAAPEDRWVAGTETRPARQ